MTNKTNAIDAIDAINQELDDTTRRLAHVYEPAGETRDLFLSSLALSIDKARLLAVFYSRTATQLQALLDSVEQRLHPEGVPHDTSPK